MTRGRFQQKQWEQRAEAILHALERLSAEHGFGAVTMDALADEVGISKATLYQHFDSKDELLAELLKRHLDRFLASLESTADLPPIERLCAAMRMLMDGHLTPLQGLIVVGRDEALPVFYSTPALIERHNRTISTLAAIIEQGQADGSITRELDAPAVIGAMLALSSGSVGTGSGLSSRQFNEAIPGYEEQMVKFFERAVRSNYPPHAAQ
jgi:AcrR family transcriptional regulator